MKNEFSIQEHQPTDWFEALYATSNTDGAGVPWANMTTHPLFADWLAQHPLEGSEKRALVVGCGMGDDAIALEALGFQVTAFDVSETAIKFCKERFPESTVDFLQADLLTGQPQWLQQFDFVLEIFTIQALPPRYESQVIETIASFVAPKGELLVIAGVSKEERSFENGPPWLLTAHHTESFKTNGLSVIEQMINKMPASMNERYVTLFSK